MLPFVAGSQNPIPAIAAARRLGADKGEKATATFSGVIHRQTW
jgi:hypothetical protein